MNLKFNVNLGVIESARKFLEISYPEYQFIVRNTFIFVVPEPVSDVALKMKNIIGTIEFSEKIKKAPLVYEHETLFKLNYKNVDEELERSGQVKWMDPGLAFFEGSFLAVKKNIMKMWEGVSENEYSAWDIENPGLWSEEIFKKTGYLKDFPQEAILIGGAVKHSNNLDIFSKLFDSSECDERTFSRNQIKILGGCQPSVCTSCYFALSKYKNIANKIYTTGNRVFRNEGSSDLSRLKSFTVRDIMAVGEKDFVAETRDRFIRSFIEIGKKAGIKFKVEAANDPFFANNLKKISFQNSGALKHEILAYIPHREVWIAIGSVNLHLETFGKNFGITSNNGEIANSCCVGLGYERFVYALFSQFGVNVEKWPASTRAFIGLQ